MALGGVGRWFGRRWRDVIGSGDRVVGIDIARGLAVLGMFAVHTYVIDDSFDWLDPTSWSALAWGNSSATFAVLAGVGISFLSGGTRPVDGVQLLQARMRILTRAVLIVAIGGILVALGSGLVVIVEFYGLFFAMSLPFLRLRWWALAAWGFGWLLLSPPLRLLADAGLQVQPWTSSAIVDWLITGFYPALTWFSYTLIGMAIGRLPLRRWSTRLWLLAVGVVLVAFANIEAMLLDEIPSSLFAPVLNLFPDLPLRDLLSAAGHSGSTLDLMSSSGVAMIVISLCIMAERWVRWVLFPIAAVGSMSLTAYTAQAVWFTIAGLDPASPFPNDPWSWFNLAGFIALGCTVWRLLLPRGPLEAGMWWVSRRASDVRPRREARSPVSA